MTRVVVDTNIVFSAILNTSSDIGDVLFGSDQSFTFYTAEYLRNELDRNRDKLMAISSLNKQEIIEAQFYVFNKIRFLSEEQIPTAIWEQSMSFVKEVDMDDIAFVALSMYLEASLWTGDKKLIKGLQAKGFTKCISTRKLIELRGL
jgi:predicted nucleic acid-binding protein